jgi:uncharacterized protein YjbJ (UPF0337 family)
MTNDVLKGNWKQLKGEVLKQWGKLTNDELDKVNGERLKLEGLLQERYGLKQEEAQKKLSEFVDKHSV